MKKIFLYAAVIFLSCQNHSVDKNALPENPSSDNGINGQSSDDAAKENSMEKLNKEKQTPGNDETKAGAGNKGNDAGNSSPGNNNDGNSSGNQESQNNGDNSKVEQPKPDQNTPGSGSGNTTIDPAPKGQSTPGNIPARNGGTYGGKKGTLNDTADESPKHTNYTPAIKPSPQQRNGNYSGKKGTLSDTAEEAPKPAPGGTVSTKSPANNQGTYAGQKGSLSDTADEAPKSIPATTGVKKITGMLNENYSGSKGNLPDTAQERSQTSTTKSGAIMPSPAPPPAFNKPTVNNSVLTGSIGTQENRAEVQSIKPTQVITPTSKHPTSSPAVPAQINKSSPVLKTIKRKD